MRGARSLSVAVLFLFASVLSAAQPVMPSSTMGPFLTPASVDWKTILPPPVPQDSAEEKAELNLMVAVQHSAAPQAMAQAEWQKKHMNVNSFADIIGPWFKPENLPETEALFHEIEHESKTCVTTPAKKFFERVRPANVDSRVNGTHEHEFSYPSGHSTRATMYAYVLSALYPQLKDKFIERSQEIGFNRIVVGAHFPSDIVAGRVIGKAIALRLLADPQFQKALDECRAELTAVQARGDDDPDLAVVTHAWPMLPADVRKMIVGVIKATLKH